MLNTDARQQSKQSPEIAANHSANKENPCDPYPYKLACPKSKQLSLEP